MVWRYKFKWWCKLSEVSNQTCKNYIKSKNKFFMWHKATHTVNCNKQWLEHIDSPDIAWNTWWEFSFLSTFAQYTTKTCWTNTWADRENFQLSRARVIISIFWWVRKRILWIISWTYKDIWIKKLGHWCSKVVQFTVNIMACVVCSLSYEFFPHWW